MSKQEENAALMRRGGEERERSCECEGKYNRTRNVGCYHHGEERKNKPQRSGRVAV